MINRMPALIGGFGKINKNTIKRYFSTEKHLSSNEESELRSKLGPYLAGLIEADGSFAVHNKDSNAKKYRPKILVVFSTADEPLAKKLASITNAGKVYNKNNAGCVIWHIQKTEDVLKIIDVINGYMRTPKIEALHRAINWFNEFDNCSINCLGLDQSSIDSNAWLAGFATSNSSFIITTHKRKNSTRVLLNFKLMVNFVIPNTEKEEWYGSVYFSLFSKISEYLNTSFISKTKHSNIIKYTFILFAYVPESQEMLIKYFSKFPLLGEIYLDYKHWCEALSNKNNSKGVENLKMHTLNRNNLLGNNLCYLPNLNLSNQRNFSTSSNLQGKRESNIYLSICTDLVVWGENLPSGVGWGRHTKQEREMIVIPSFQYSVIVGLLLSDGWLVIASATHISPRLGLSQSLSHFKYVWFVFNALSLYCDRFPVLRERKRGTKTHWCVDVVTRALPCFSEIYSLFYVNKKKVIPHNIYELFTPVAFAHLIMGDGGFKSKGIFLCTDSYSIQDVVRLMNVLIIRYDLKCTLHKSYENYRIYISRNSSAGREK